jgi:hypothetical protein
VTLFLRAQDMKKNASLRTTITKFKPPADLRPYQPTEAEKAASVGDMTELEVGRFPDGTLLYRVAGCEADTWESLERDGLIKTKWRNGRRTKTLVYYPNNPRVIAWQLSENNLSRRNGEPAPFPGVTMPIIPSPPPRGVQ